MATSLGTIDVELGINHPLMLASGRSNAPDRKLDQNNGATLYNAQSISDYEETTSSPVSVKVSRTVVPEYPYHARLLSLSLFAHTRSSLLRNFIMAKVYAITSFASERPWELLPERVLKEARHGVFVCFKRSGYSSYAVRMKCLRPSQHRTCLGTTTCRDGTETRVYSRVASGDRAVECDSAIYERIRHVCYADQGWWKRLVPFFDADDVEEVTVGTCPDEKPYTS